MTTRENTIALIAGIILGAAATEGFNIYRQSQDSSRQSHESRVFQERLHCKAVADAYVKENTDLNDNGAMGSSVTLEKVDYSPARNSCVAELEETTYYRGGALVFESVRDVLSGETLFSTRCAEGCEILTMPFVNSVFDDVKNNAAISNELEKEWALREPKRPPPGSSPDATPQVDWSKAQPISKNPPSGFTPDAPASQHKSAPSPGR